jgi:hypothetical protein
MRPEHSGREEEALGLDLDLEPALDPSSSSPSSSSSSATTAVSDHHHHSNGGGLLQQAFDAYHRYAADEDHLVRDSALQTVLADHGVPTHEVRGLSARTHTAHGKSLLCVVTVT